MSVSSRTGPGDSQAPVRLDGDALAVTGLSVAYRVRGRDREVLRDVTLSVRRGEAYGLVGESGCGKSTLALAALSYLPNNGRITAGRIAVAGADMASLDAKQLRAMRATTISMVYQDPSRALNPSLKIGLQLCEAFEAARGMGGLTGTRDARGMTRATARSKALEMLERVRIPAPNAVMERYAHQLSGGMQQRIVIAMALASNPALLVLDEPTTGLDATVEAEVLDLIETLRDESGMAILLVSHNLSVIHRICSRIGVLYAGRLVEEGPIDDVLGVPHHPYTVGLLRSLPDAAGGKNVSRLQTISGSLPPPGMVERGCVYAPRCPMADERCHRDAPQPQRFFATHGEQMARCHYHERAHLMPPPEAATAIDAHGGASPHSSATDGGARPRLAARNLSKTFGGPGHSVRVVDDVSLTLAAGETLGLVGESGSGKSTLAKLLVGLIAPDAGGTVELDGEPMRPRVTARSKEHLKSLQIVFQNPDSALNRRHSVRRLIGRALSKLAGLRSNAKDARLAALIDAVRLPPRYLGLRANQLSGGLKQRVAIARAFAGEPRIVVCDEPTSSLDVSVQAAILNLLVDLQRERGVSYLFISHDLNVVRYLSDRVAVLYMGRVVEIGSSSDVFGGPHHPYTKALLSSMRGLSTARAAHRARVRLFDDTASAGTGACGCAFHTRCHRKLGAICEERDPPFADAGNGHLIRCHIPVSELDVSRQDPADTGAKPTRG